MTRWSPVLFLLAAGCGTTPWWTYDQAVEVRSSDGRSARYTVASYHTENPSSRPHKAIFGKKGEMILPSKYEEVYVWHPDFAYARPWGKDLFVRAALDGSGAVEETNIRKILRTNIDQAWGGRSTALTGYYGLISGEPFGPPGKVLALFREDGRVGSEVRRADLVDRLRSGAYVVTHYPEGQKFAGIRIFYSPDGIPVSPPLTGIARLQSTDAAGSHYALHLTGSLVWPINDRGEAERLPPGVVGLEAITQRHYGDTNTSPVVFWLVKWMAEGGSFRWTSVREISDLVVGQSTPNTGDSFEEILTPFQGKQTWTQETPVFAVRRAGSKEWEIVGPDATRALVPRLDRKFPAMADAWEAYHQDVVRRAKEHQEELRAAQAKRDAEAAAARQAAERTAAEQTARRRARARELAAEWRSTNAVKPLAHWQIVYDHLDWGTPDKEYARQKIWEIQAAEEKDRERKRDEAIRGRDGWDHFFGLNAPEGAVAPSASGAGRYVPAPYVPQGPQSFQNYLAGRQNYYWTETTGYVVTRPRGSYK
jgi:hypothetical protein